MGISVSGIASGLDVDGIIGQLLGLEQRSILILQRKIGLLEARKAAYNDLDGRLSVLRSAARGLDDTGLFADMDVSTSDDTLASATATAEAADGRYSLVVKQIATQHRMAAQGFADTDVTGVAQAAGTFEFQVGEGAAQSVAVDASTTLRQLTDAINATNSGVRADIVNDGTATNPYRLVLTSSEPGEDNLISVTNNDSDLDFANKAIEAAVADDDNAADYTGTVTSGGAYTGTANTSFVVEITTGGRADGTAKFQYSTDGGLSFDDNGGAGYDVTSAGPIALADGVTIEFTDDGTDLTVDDRFDIDVFNPELETPQDAIINVNGLDIRKSSNSISDVFDGVTFSLNNADPTKTVNLDVDRSVGDVAGALAGFIGAYNGALGFLSAQFAYDPNSGAAAPPLNGDSAARQIQRSLKDFVGGRISVLGDDVVSSLSELGVETNQETGLLSLNTADLNAVLDSDPGAVERLLTSFGEVVNGDAEFLDRTSKTEQGTYDVRITQARVRAELEGGAPAEVLSADETLSFTFNENRDAGGAAIAFDVDLLNGDTTAQQVAKIQAGFDLNNADMTVFLDGAGALVFRASQYGSDHEITVQSDRAAGAGTTNVDNVLLTHRGTEAEGTIGGHPVDVTGDLFEGKVGFATEGLEIRIPTDRTGRVGQVRVVDGLGEALPGLIESFTGGTGIIGTRTSGVDTSIEDLEAQILRQNRRVAKTEQRLRRTFTNLEVQLGQLNALGEYVTQQLSALNQNNRK